MSLMRTLAAVAVGVAATKGAQALANRSGGTGGSARGGAGGLLNALQGQAGGGSGGLGQLLGGGGSAGGGLGGLLESLGGGGSGGAGALGGLQGMLGGGAAGGLLSSLTGGNAGSQPDFGRRLNEAFQNGGEPADPPTPDEEAMAALMLRGMIMAVKADGRVDAGERDALLKHLGDLDPAEREFVQSELNAPMDIDGFARDVPDHPALKAQIYAVALSAIDIDSPSEQRFAEELAGALGLDGTMRAQVHDRLARF
ncbi:DUF533 domain-containing protein [Gymnodinialimonas ulvae]|uniref:DUF533 domain-containing protein n=1 Tax=Gymnodinialimonas ulvae TaxID=3126504 RepID=UPI003097F67B